MSAGVIPHRARAVPPPKVISNQRGGGAFSAPRPNFLTFSHAPPMHPTCTPRRHAPRHIHPMIMSNPAAVFSSNHAAAALRPVFVKQNRKRETNVKHPAACCILGQQKSIFKDTTKRGAIPPPLS